MGNDDTKSDKSKQAKKPTSTEKGKKSISAGKSKDVLRKKATSAPKVGNNSKNKTPEKSKSAKNNSKKKSKQKSVISVQTHKKPRTVPVVKSEDKPKTVSKVKLENKPKTALKAKSKNKPCSESKKSVTGKKKSPEPSQMAQLAKKIVSQVRALFGGHKKDDEQKKSKSKGFSAGKKSRRQRSHSRKKSKSKKSRNAFLFEVEITKGAGMKYSAIKKFPKLPQMNPTGRYARGNAEKKASKVVIKSPNSSAKKPKSTAKSSGNLHAPTSSNLTTVSKGKVSNKP